MLEATFILEAILGKWPEAIIIALLLLFNGILGFSQERKAKNALALLRERLRIQARVCRDGKWQTIVAAELVPGDLIHVRVGDIVPADLHLTEGNVLVDQSALTGESMPVECAAEGTLYSASIIRRGEASGEVVATGAKSYFGKTAELVRSAGAKSHLEELVLSIVRYLVAMDVLLVVAILTYAMVENISLAKILPFALILLVASVPVALPATFTLATAIASLPPGQSDVLAQRSGGHRASSWVGAETSQNGNAGVRHADLVSHCLDEPGIPLGITLGALRLNLVRLNIRRNPGCQSQARELRVERPTIGRINAANQIRRWCCDDPLWIVRRRHAIGPYRMFFCALVYTASFPGHHHAFARKYRHPVDIGRVRKYE